LPEAFARDDLREKMNAGPLSQRRVTE